MTARACPRPRSRPSLRIPANVPARDFPDRGPGPGDFGAELDRRHYQRDRGGRGPGGVQPGDVIGNRGIGLAVDRNRGVQAVQRGGVGEAGVVGDARRDQLAGIVADRGDGRGRVGFDGRRLRAFVRILKMPHKCNYRASFKPPVNG